MPSRRLVAAALSLVAGLAIVPSGTARADKATIGLISAGAAFLAYSAIANPAQDEEPDVLSVGTGVSDPVDRQHVGGLFQVEYRPALWGARTGALVGLAGTTDRRLMGYAGLRHDIVFVQSLLVSFNLSLAAYRIHGDGEDLARLPQFRTGFDIHYKLPGGSRVGFSFQHFSNAEVFEKSNPGTETLAFTYTIPIGRL